MTGQPKWGEGAAKHAVTQRTLRYHPAAPAVGLSPGALLHTINHPNANMAPKKRPRPAAGPDLPALMKKLLTSRGRNVAVKELVRFVHDNDNPREWSRCQAVYDLLLSTQGALQALIGLLGSGCADDALALLHNDAIALSEAFKDELAREAQLLLKPAAAAIAADKLRRIAYNHEQLVANVLLSTDGAIEALVRLLDSDRTDAVGDAAALLHNDTIALSEAFQELLVRVGAVDKLVALLATEEDDIAQNAAGAIGLLVIVNDENDDFRADGHLRVLEVYEADAVPALHSMLARGAASCVAQQAAATLKNILRGGNTSVEWAMLKWLENKPPPVDFPILMDALREMSQSFVDGARPWVLRYGGRSSGVDARLRHAMTIADSINDRKGFKREGDYYELVNALGGPSN